MNLDDLRSVRASERKTDSLQHLRDSFYEDVGDYIADLRRRREEAAEAAADPFASEEVRRLTDEIETATEVAEAIYERRMGKLVKHASLVAAGMAADEEGMTAEERELFAGIVDRIEANKAEVLSVLSGEDGDPSGDDGATDEPAVSTAAVMSDRDAAEDGDAEVRASDRSEEASPQDTPRVESDPSTEAPDRRDATGTPPEGGGSSGSEPAAPEGSGRSTGEAPGSSTDDGSGTAGEAADRLTVRITADVGEILGVDDRSYELQSEDVVTLPEANAKPLVERDAAEPLE